MRSRGFTLIELLLVVLIAALVVGLAVPRFVGSYKGARLRNSVRTAVRLHRYARSTAVLEQQASALLFDVARGTITLISLPESEAPAGFLDGQSDDSFFSDDSVLSQDDYSEEEPDVEVARIEEVAERTLEKSVRISDFKNEIADQEIDGIHWVNYFPNGMCDPYELRMVGPDGESAARIKVDAVSGRIEVDYE